MHLWNCCPAQTTINTNMEKVITLGKFAARVALALLIINLVSSLVKKFTGFNICLLYTSPSPRDS